MTIQACRQGSKRRVSESTDGDRPSKAARKRASSDTREWENISVLRRRIGKNEEAELDHIVQARAEGEAIVLTIVWKKPDAMAYVNLESKYLDTRRSEALRSREQATKTIYRVGSQITVYGAWQVRQGE